MTRWALIGIAGVALLWAVVDWHHRLVANAVADARAAWNTAVELDRAQSELDARSSEAEQREALAAVERRYQQELSDAQSRADDLVSDLRADNVRLQRHWQGCENATARVSATAAAAGELDALAELRAAAAARIVRVGARCDAQVRGLQAALMTQGETR